MQVCGEPNSCRAIHIPTLLLQGCYAQLKPDEISGIPGVRLVLGAGEKFNIVQHVEDTFESGELRSIAGEIRDVKEFIPSFSHGDQYSNISESSGWL
jgi:threonylcarbamoyladenosine tRNA methylthiotransferase MtaB